jgi:hypothetical protein
MHDRTAHRIRGWGPGDAAGRRVATTSASVAAAASATALVAGGIAALRGAIAATLVTGIATVPISAASPAGSVCRGAMVHPDPDQILAHIDNAQRIVAAGCSRHSFKLFRGDVDRSGA